MRLIVENLCGFIGPSSPFARSCLVMSDEAQDTDIMDALRDWCEDRWGATVSRSEASNGNFPDDILWYQVVDRFWFKRDQHYVEFRMRWHGATT